MLSIAEESSAFMRSSICSLIVRLLFTTLIRVRIAMDAIRTGTMTTSILLLIRLNLISDLLTLRVERTVFPPDIKARL